MEKKTISKWIKAGIVVAVVVVAAGAAVFAAGSPETITESEAKQIALSQVDGADISNITECKKDKDNGRTEWDIEIIYDGFEYDFEISAKDGTIFDQSKEVADAAALAKLEKKNGVKSESQGSNNTVVVEQTRSDGGSSGISLEKAKSIALGQVPGASAGNITKAYKDYDDGRAEYDIEIVYNGYEYDFEIDGTSGAILEKDIDRYDYDDDDRYDD